MSFQKRYLMTSTKNRVAICNANSLEVSYKDVDLQNIINNFIFKAPDGFLSQKHYPFYKKNFQELMDLKFFTN